MTATTFFCACANFDENERAHHCGRKLIIDPTKDKKLALYFGTSDSSRELDYIVLDRAGLQRLVRRIYGYALLEPSKNSDVAEARVQVKRLVRALERMKEELELIAVNMTPVSQEALNNTGFALKQANEFLEKTQ